MTKIARLSLATFIGATLGCADATPEPNAPEPEPAHERRAAPPPAPTAEEKPSPPFEHGDDTEYQNGLTAMLFAAPVLGAKQVTTLFRWGYLIGLAEANGMAAHISSSLATVGCLVGVEVVAKDRNEMPLARTTSALVPFSEFCNSLQRPEFKGNGPQGKLFSRDRLKVAQQSAERSDPEETRTRDLMFVVGYNMGFAHAWEGIDHEAMAAKTALDGCLLADDAEPKPSPPLLHKLADACAAYAQSERNSDTTHGLKCLLVGHEANSNLSGLESKPGCTPSK